jgi:cob(I)alamin adenosyltransferase
MNIYTKTGDDGTTGLIGGTRVPKDDIRLDAYGSVDELNSFLSLLLTENLETHDREFIQDTQHLLFKICSLLATDALVSEPSYPIPVSEDKLISIEKEIDSISANLPIIKNFVIPGGNRTSSLCHVCRSICRRAERNVIKVSRIYGVEKSVLVFLNRFSDYLFILGRKACIMNGKEIFWDNSK